MTPTRQERKENITRMRRQQILDAALDVFSRNGFAMATTAEIAHTAGLAEGTIYNYFDSKRELFIAVIRDLVITVPLLDLIEELPEKGIGVTFTDILMNRLELIESGSISHIPYLMGEIQRDPELKALWAEQFIQPFLSQVDGVYRLIMKSGKVRSLEPDVVVRAIGGLVLGFIMLKMMEGDASPINQLPKAKVAWDLKEFVLYGLSNEKTIQERTT
jgi:AcrR family transcriptional regulator